MAAMRAAAALLALGHASAAPIDALWWNMTAAVKGDHLTYADQARNPTPDPSSHPPRPPAG